MTRSDHKHRLVVIGDSLSQGFMSGAIHRTDISYPVFVADALGVRSSFVVPDFSGQGGLPLNLEKLLGDLGDKFGRAINWWEVVPVLALLQWKLDLVEDYWERGKGSKAHYQVAVCNNLAVWGFEVRDALTVTEGACRRAIPTPRDNPLKQVPEMPMYRTARRVLNPTFGGERTEWSQIRSATALATEGGIENLVIALGANNALGTVISLHIEYSKDEDLHRMPHERSANLYLPEHFEILYADLAHAVDQVEAKRVFVATVPHVTIPPLTRGVSPHGSALQDGYYEFYTRPWIWDEVFDPDRHQHLTREEARRIDEIIDSYNEIIRRTARQRGWFVFDLCKLLDDLAFRRSNGQPKYKAPAGLTEALRDHEGLNYLVSSDGGVRLDSRFIRSDNSTPGRLIKGGIFSLDGVHPTTIGYSLIADLLVKTMKKAKVEFPDDGELPWNSIVQMDTLINNPPSMLSSLRDCLAFFDKHGLLSSILEHFE